MEGNTLTFTCLFFTPVFFFATFYSSKNMKAKALKTSQSWFGRKTKKNRKPKQEPGPQPHLKLHARRLWRESQETEDKAASAPQDADLPGVPRPGPRLQQVDTPRPPGHGALRRTVTAPYAKLWPGVPDTPSLGLPTPKVRFANASLSHPKAQKAARPPQRKALPQERCPDVGGPMSVHPQPSPCRSLTL